MTITTDTDRDGALTGVAVGIVTDNEDPEGMGRVKLEFPWREADDESYWARIAAPMAGADRGTYFLPEIDDEVLVAFENGDLRYPYVLGGLWNGQDSPPAENEGSNDVRSITSRSGHELQFDDADQGANVELTTAGGHTVTMDDSSGGETITIEDSSGQNTITFDGAAGTLDITGGTTLTIEATNVEVTGSGSLKLASDGILTIEGSLVKIN